MTWLCQLRACEYHPCDSTFASVQSCLYSCLAWGIVSESNDHLYEPFLLSLFFSLILVLFVVSISFSDFVVLWSLMFVFSRHISWFCMVFVFPLSEDSVAAHKARQASKLKHTLFNLLGRFAERVCIAAISHSKDKEAYIAKFLRKNRACMHHWIIVGSSAVCGKSSETLGKETAVAEGFNKRQNPMNPFLLFLDHAPSQLCFGLRDYQHFMHTWDLAFAARFCAERLLQNSPAFWGKSPWPQVETITTQTAPAHAACRKGMLVPRPPMDDACTRPHWEICGNLSFRAALTKGSWGTWRIKRAKRLEVFHVTQLVQVTHSSHKHTAIFAQAFPE